jgi:cytidylate kinase
VKSTIQIAIDGYSSCGKSTLAKAIAQSLGYIYIDSGAMYRAVTLYFLSHAIDPLDLPAAHNALEDIHISFVRTAEGIHTVLNGEDVEHRIREMDVAGRVSQVATNVEVRRAMVRQQRNLAQGVGVVMDGRDIGTVVFPQAALKIFLTASVEERVKRRHLQLKSQDKLIPIQDIRQNLFTRDYIDSTRSDSPLMRAEDSVVIDNTNLSETEQLLMALALIHERISLHLEKS